MPDFVRGYRGAEEAEDCSSLACLPVEFHETFGAPLNGEPEVRQRTSYALKVLLQVQFNYSRSSAPKLCTSMPLRVESTPSRTRAQARAAEGGITLGSP
jgi:hypothetical protein